MTRLQALSAQEFHFDAGSKCVRWRRNGRTQLWKTRPLQFRIPVKHGLYAYDAITERDLGRPDLHVATECPRHA